MKLEVTEKDLCDMIETHLNILTFKSMCKVNNVKEIRDVSGPLTFEIDFEQLQPAPDALDGKEIANES